jgi:predicted  nucleic acid-binding Zn-ribbon protein
VTITTNHTPAAISRALTRLIGETKTAQEAIQSHRAELDRQEAHLLKFRHALEAELGELRDGAKTG